MGHFYGRPPWEFDDVLAETLFYWHNEAVRTYNKLNPDPNG